MKDDIYNKTSSSKGSFKFNAEVANVFEDMIKRSVPGYELALEMIGVIAQYTLKNKDAPVAIDLGCSLGASMDAILSHSTAQVIGVDNSLDMLKKASTNLEAKFKGRFQLHHEDITTYQFPQQSHFIILNFTLQFIPLELRNELLEKCFNSLAPNGVLLISEKILIQDSTTNTYLRSLHHEFKKHNGYSAKEIMNKRDAIENVLVPETTETHLHRLESAGFENPTCWYQCFNFASFIAAKS